MTFTKAINVIYINLIKKKGLLNQCSMYDLFLAKVKNGKYSKPSSFRFETILETEE